MKICIVTDSPYPWGGNEAREIEFAQALNKNGEEVHILCPYIPEECEDMEKLEGLILHGRNASSQDGESPFKAIQNLSYYFKEINNLKEQIDIFHFANHGRSAIGGLFSEILDFPNISSLHSVRPPNRERNKKDLNEKIVTRCSDGILTTTELAKKYFLQKNGFHLENRTWVVPNTVDMEEVGSYRRNHKSLAKRDTIIGTFSAWHPPETEFQKVVEGVAKEIPKAKGLIIGKKPPKDKRVKSELISYTGYVEDLSNVFKKIKIGFTTGAGKGAGFRSRITEYVKRGIPVISYPPYVAEPSWGFAIEDGVVITLDNLNDVTEEIIDFLSGKERQINAWKRCFSTIENIGYSKIYLKLINVYSEVLKRH